MTQVSKDKIANREGSSGGAERSWLDAIAAPLGLLAGILLSKSGLIDRLLQTIGRSLGIGSGKEQKSGPTCSTPSPAGWDQLSDDTVRVPSLSGAPAPGRDTPRRGH